MQCVLCAKDCPPEEMTHEHVFPAALGGHLELKNGTCRSCNNGCSDSEQIVARELAPLRRLLNIPDRRGDLPIIDATAKTADREYQARLLPDGQIQVKPIVTKEVAVDGVTEVVFRFATENQKEDLRQRAADKRIKLTESGPGEPLVAEIHIGGDIEMIGAEEGLRVASKIAYVGLAFRAGRQFAMSPAFDKIRDYVREWEGECPARLFVNYRYLDVMQQGPHQHSLTIAARRDKRRVDAIVRLFGFFCYFVSLSGCYDGADFSDTLVYDAYRGEINGILVEHPEAEFSHIRLVETDAGTLWNDVPAAGECFCELLNRAIRAKVEQDPEQRE